MRGLKLRRSGSDSANRTSASPSADGTRAPSRSDDATEKSHTASLDNPFNTPPILSTHPSSVGLNTVPERPTYFRSRRVKKEQIEKPWLNNAKDPRQKWQTLIPMIGMIVGIGLGGFMAFTGWTSIVEHEYCPIYEDDFSSGALNMDIWEKEIQLGGFGNGQFEQTTGGDENVFIKDGVLTILPTLQDEKFFADNQTLDLTGQGCTSTRWLDCVATTNTTNGTIINPVKSARITTKKGAHIKYGRVEVVAKVSTGDWLWPAIWMMPVDSVYGEWPKSGEMDIAEFRGNNHTYPRGGNNVVASTLHWGPDGTNDAWWRTFGTTSALMTTFSDKYHTFGLEWSEKYVYMYLDSRLNQIQYNSFGKPFWKRGDFPLSNLNGTSYVDPWSQTGDPATPFDQNFFLILNVAVGGTNGWFEDGLNNKPWVDQSPTAKRDFWRAKDEWLPTWTDPAMKVKSVKIWQQKGYNGC